MQNATDRFLNAMRERGMKVKGAGRDRWRGQCPAHEGDDLNLAFAKGDQGVIVKCWSHGCSDAEIASSLGLRMQDLFDKDGKATYDYGGGYIVQRWRVAPKKPGGSQKVVKPVDEGITPEVRPLWVPPGSASIAESNVVGLCEGEKTADSLVRMGVPCVATWPGGTGAVDRVELEPLRGKTVRIVPDNDAPGMKAARRLFHRIEKIASVALWMVPDTYDGMPLNDAADLRLAGGVIEDLIRKEAPDPEPEPVDERFEESVNDRLFYNRVIAEARQREQAELAAQVSTKLAPRPLGEIVNMDWSYDWVVPDLLERGDRLIVTGQEGLGKSVFLRQIAICAAAGVNPFDLSIRNDPVRVLVVDSENTEKQWSRGARYITRLAAGVGSADPAKTVMVSAGVRIDLTAKPDINQVHRLIDVHKPDLLYIGPLYKLVPRAIMTDDDAAPLIETLDGLRERGLTLLMEAHAGHGKGSTGERDLRPRGSSALLGWPEFGFGLMKHADADNLAWVVEWRGQREHRKWPRMIRRGDYEFRELPWEPEVPAND